MLSGGATNRASLIAILGSSTVLEGPPPPLWYAAQRASGALDPEPDPVAVVIAAIEVYEADLALAQKSFRASAERGRPEHPERVAPASTSATAAVTTASAWTGPAPTATACTARRGSTPSSTRRARTSGGSSWADGPDGLSPSPTTR